MASAPIYASKTTDGSQPYVRRMPEAASKTFLMGVPLTLVSGNLQEWNGTSLTGAIAGFSLEAAKNRTTAGVGQLVNADVAPPNQSNAHTIALPPFDDGLLNLAAATQASVFYGQVGAAQGPVTNAFIGVANGMTKDSDGHWYVDTAKTTTSGGGSSNEAVVTVVGKDDTDPRGVYFVVLAAAAQII